MRIWIALSLLLATACDDDARSPGSGPEAFGELTVHTDLLTRVHLADIHHHGLFIDLGTAAQAKYTVGDWRSGWGTRGTEGDVTFANAGRRARLYFHSDAAEALTVRLRLKPIGTQALTPYINGEQIQSVFFEEGNGFRDVDFRLPEEHVRRGENYLLLTFGGARRVGAEDVSVAIDSARIGPSTPDADLSGLRPNRLVSEVTLDEVGRQATVMPRNSTFRFHLEVPRSGKLGFGVGHVGEGEALATVTVTPEGGNESRVFSKQVGGEWHDEVVDLSSHGGKVVRIELAAPGDGAGTIAWSALSLLTPPVETREIDRAKNVIVILTDTLRADKLRAYNPRSRVQTPVLDSIAENGVVFETAQSPENWTKPSVASILTGLHPVTHGARTQDAILSGDALMLGEHFKANGFATAGFIANGYVSDRFGFDQGWDRYRNFIREEGSSDASNVFREAGDWAEAHKDERFFLYVQPIDPHVPYDPGDQYLRMYDNRTDYTGQVRPRATPDLLHDAKRNPPRVTFNESDVRRLEALHDGEITQHDVELGRFIERLKSLGVWEDTVLVFTSDHGEEFHEHGSWGHGHSVYQELLHVPLIVHYPESISAGRVSDTVSTMDIGPTIVELAGVRALPAAEGRSLVPLMQGGRRAVPEMAFSDFQDERRVTVSANFKFIVRGNLTTSIFDLGQDPGEENQLDLTDRPIAARYLRIHSGQFLGSTDRGNWMSANQGRGVQLRAGEVRMDDTLRGQLEALGYAH
ncbi:MAG: sulfatase [Myxococcota bacterium]